MEFDYEAEQPDELSIRTGDVITSVKQMEGGWWEGTCKGKRGLFPDNFVKVRQAMVHNKPDIVRQSLVPEVS